MCDAAYRGVVGVLDEPHAVEEPTNVAAQLADAYHGLVTQGT